MIYEKSNISGIYYVYHEQTRLQIFNSKWTHSSHIFNDFETIKELFDINSTDEITIHGRGLQFKIGYNDYDEKHCLIYNGKDFFIDASYGYSYIMQQGGMPIRIYSNKQLNDFIGYDVNDFV